MSNVEKFTKPYFQIYGSQETGDYIITGVSKSGTSEVLHEIKQNRNTGLKEARLWIFRYVGTNQEWLNAHREIGEYVVKPKRLKNSWRSASLEEYISNIYNT
ncbi:hypothetical protein P6P90_06705 [Ectobacillus antri]|uniref:Uncharacterized protein n=1 Tax=Ectobacillus antri TaxID=2486280 RepID=A0ABT6H4U3_9BACI|nr:MULTISPECIES: hypothetical protein [Ectobacillus]MDG4658094.1 hypothetical protein [Ectobacillus antri]MDG5753665.1 hypothetical protein [Ectobacillus antri]UOY93299.1 hypothetical protein MUG87_04000 [Ectobacillus sp. JY-23]